MSREMTQAEFGMDLYEVIFTCAKTQQVLRMISAEVGKGRETTDLAAQYGRLKAQAKEQASSPNLADEDVAKLLRAYPWLGH